MKPSHYITIGISVALLLILWDIGRFVFSQYNWGLSRLESATERYSEKLETLEKRIYELEQVKPKTLKAFRIRGVIETAAQPQSSGSRSTREDGIYQASNAKGGPVILPDLRLPKDSVEGTFEVRVSDSRFFGTTVDAWLSYTDSLDDLSAFEEFKVTLKERGRPVIIQVKAKPGALMEAYFTLVVLCEK